MSEHLDFFALDRSPFADEVRTPVVIGTRPLRKLVARIQASLRDGGTRIGVCGEEGIGKTCLARALPKLFAGNSRVATLFDPGTDWRTLRASLARDWQLIGEKLSRAGLVEAARSHRLILVIDRAEAAPDSLLGHLDVLQDIRDESGRPVVSVILFLRSTGEASGVEPPALGWLGQSGATVLRFEPLAPDAVGDYVERHLRHAGYQGSPLFTPRAGLAIHAETRGVPGAISRLCEQLLVEAAAKRLRTLDEPFVRALQAVSREGVTRAVEANDEAWDDADHHPRETPADELLLEHAIAPPEPRRPMATGVRPASGEVGDPELEAFLSAPPSEAELRAIRGGFLRRTARPIALASIAAALGGLLLALLLRDRSPAQREPATGSSDAAAIALARPTPASTSNAAPGAQAPPVLGRLRGPVLPSAPVPPPRRSSAAAPPARNEATPVASPLQRAGDLGDQDRAQASTQMTLAADEDMVSEEPDLRPTDLTPPAEFANPDL